MDMSTPKNPWSGLIRTFRYVCLLQRRSYVTILDQIKVIFEHTAATCFDARLQSHKIASNSYLRHPLIFVNLSYSDVLHKIMNYMTRGA